jgi:hypothetical protein
MILASFEIEKLLAAITGAGGAIVLAALWIRYLIAQLDSLILMIKEKDATIKEKDAAILSLAERTVAAMRDVIASDGSTKERLDKIEALLASLKPKE